MAACRGPPLLRFPCLLLFVSLGVVVRLWLSIIHVPPASGALNCFWLRGELGVLLKTGSVTWASNISMRSCTPHGSAISEFP